MQNLNHRVIKVKYIQETNNKASRCSLSESRHDKTNRKIISFDYGNYTLENAVKYLESIGVNIVGWGQYGKEYFIFSDSWADGEGFINIDGKTEI
jgi:hypothetical protein